MKLDCTNGLSDIKQASAVYCCHMQLTQYLSCYIVAQL